MPVMRNRHPLSSILGACLFLGAALAPGIAFGQQVILQSTEPYWKVGALDKELSRLCSINRFGERLPGRYTARFLGPEGTQTLGIAKGSGLNLRDVDRKAKPTEDYFFLNHGTSSCQVYVGGRTP
jgi:hypothetical protein